MPVVSVGNVTVGGTGKTPVVELVVRGLLERGRRPAILSRGYGGHLPHPSAPGLRVNDEFLVLAQHLPDVLHVQQPDRVAAGRRAIEAGADCLVLDDGFQHGRLARDLDLVLVDATNPFGYGRVLPAGLLREPLDVLARADCIAITRGRLVGPRALGVIRTFLRSRFAGVPRIEIDFEPVAWRGLGDRGSEAVESVETLEGRRGARALGFAGIGNPENFRRQLELLGVDVVKWISFPDHHRYTLEDIARLERAARDARADFVALTQKDAVKLPADCGDGHGNGHRGGHRDGAPPWRVLEIRPRVIRGGDWLEERLDILLDARRSR